MAIAGMATYQNTNSYFGMYLRSGQNFYETGKQFTHTINQHSKKIYDVTDADGEFVKNRAERNSELGFNIAQCMPVMAKGYGDPAAYTRCITASIRTQEMIAQESSDGQVIYSYYETEKSFQVIINSDEQENKTYTIKGIDDNGQEFEREFDPYALDPEDMDYPEFSALCMYIQETNETADLIASSYFTDASYFDGIFDRGDRVGLLGKYAEEYEDIEGTLASHAARLLNAINVFFEKMSASLDFDDKMLSALFTDRDNIKDTVLSNNTEYTDPSTGEKVSVSVTYTTSYSEDGISCRKNIRNGDRESGRQLWSLRFDDSEDYTRVKNLLNSFENDESLTFASQKAFWEDYLDGGLNVQEFKDYFETTVDGRIDFEGRMAAGEKLRDIVTEPYAKYLNNQSFIGHVYTEQEMRDSRKSGIGTNKKATEINGAESAAKEDPLWHWRDGILGFNAEVYRNEGSDSEYMIRLRYDNGREEERVVDVDKIDAAGCNIVDLHVKMFHLQSEGKINEENSMMNLTLAHLYMDNRMSRADQNTAVDFRSWYEQQLELEMRQGMNSGNVSRLLTLLHYL